MLFFGFFQVLHNLYSNERPPNMNLDKFVNNLVIVFFSGKSTLMNTLFNTSFDDDPRPHDLPGVRLRANSYELQETNVRLKLTLVDTVGFGDQINKDQSYKVRLLKAYVISQIADFMYTYSCSFLVAQPIFSL